MTQGQAHVVGRQLGRGLPQEQRRPMVEPLASLSPPDAMALQAIECSYMWSRGLCHVIRHQYSFRFSGNEVSTSCLPGRDGDQSDLWGLRK